MRTTVDAFGFDLYDEDDDPEDDDTLPEDGFVGTPICDWDVGDSKGRCIKLRCGCNYSGCVYNEGI